jgi:hypothetical protein
MAIGVAGTTIHIFTASTIQGTLASVLMRGEKIVSVRSLLMIPRGWVVQCGQTYLPSRFAGITPLRVVPNHPAHA